MDAKWIRFDDLGDKPGALTHQWAVIATKGDAPLGVVQWFSAWRRYCFFPRTGTLYEEQCLRDIARFCERATIDQRAHRQAVRA